ncbi:LOW QUALITY PROTEIN: uncharacterized protein kif20bb [Aplochiton taeniatus]
MMDSCLTGKPERVGPVEVDDVKRDLFADFSAIPTGSQNSVLEKEHLQVYLRIRPFSSSEKDSGESQDCVTIEGPDSVILKAPRWSLSARLSERPLTHTAQRFHFTQVYGPETSQRQMFEGTVRRLVRDVLTGNNSLVFTYGVTNSDGGLLPRSLANIQSIEGRVYTNNNLRPHRCRDFTRLPKQQDEESTSKRNLLRLFKESDSEEHLQSELHQQVTFLEGSSLSDCSDSTAAGEGDSFLLDVDSNTKYSVWVSFCEIYNENLHDLLEHVPNGNQRRTVLRLSQDVKGNSFVKDLRWVHVNSSEEAYRVMKIGKKNQSFSATKLNHLSSRSHSIFSIRILRIEDVGVPRVHTISELSLCDLAGSERCAKTQNRGERLKEAGNINTCLLTLGKCMNALRLNQQAKFQQHVPFRESKLTHYLQGFFCGRGRACMIVNINQCASMYDETLNVLKFSALAQKVVVVNIKPVLSVAPQRSAREVSMIINNAENNNNNSDLWGRGRKSSMVAWETTLEDVQEDGDEEEEEEGRYLFTPMARLALEARIREEVSSEFMELFTQMERDYSERLVKEREIMEERADKRLEILKNLVNKSVTECTNVSTDQDTSKEDKVSLLEGIVVAMREDLLRIRRDAEAAHTCLTELPETPGDLEGLRTQVDSLSEQLLLARQQTQRQADELEALRLDKQQSHVQLEETRLDKQQSHEQLEAMRLANQRLQDQLEEMRLDNQQSHDQLEAMRLEKQQSHDQLEAMLLEKQRLQDRLGANQLVIEDEKKAEEYDSRLASLDKERRDTARLTKENKALVNGIFQLQTTSQSQGSEVTALKTQLQQQTDRADSLSEQLDATKARLDSLQSQSEETIKRLESRNQEVESLRRDARVSVTTVESDAGCFRATMEALRKEGTAAVERSTQQRHHADGLQREVTELKGQLCQSEEVCSQSREKLDSLRAEASKHLQSCQAEKGLLAQQIEGLEAQLRASRTSSAKGTELEKQLSEREAQCTALRQRLEEVKAKTDRAKQERKKEEEETQAQQEDLIESRAAEIRTLSEELAHLKNSHLQCKNPEEQGDGEKMKSKKEEEEEEEEESVVLDTSDGRFPHPEVEIEFSPLQPHRLNLKRQGDKDSVTLKIPRTNRKRNSNHLDKQPVESENRKNRRLRGNVKADLQSPSILGLKSSQKQQLSPASLKGRKDGTLQKIGDFIQSSPTLLGSKAKTIMGMVVSGRSMEKQRVATVTKPKKSRRKLYKTDISSPMDIPLNPMLGAEEEEEKESDHFIIKRQLRSRTTRK